jgi:hypothetical protein
VYDLWHDLRDATREVRPDWDLSKPGLREARTGGLLELSRMGPVHADQLTEARNVVAG